MLQAQELTKYRRYVRIIITFVKVYTSLTVITASLSPNGLHVPFPRCLLQDMQCMLVKFLRSINHIRWSEKKLSYIE